MYGIYVNAESIPKSLRKALFFDVFNTLDISKDHLIPRDNIFLGEIQNTPKDTTETLFSQTASALGYTLGGTAPLPPPTKPAEPVLASLKYISQPGNVSPLFL